MHTGNDGRTRAGPQQSLREDLLGNPGDQSIATDDATGQNKISGQDQVKVHSILESNGAAGSR